jgi:hypothetical protein
MIMNQSRYDVAVACRIYPKLSASRPPIYAEDKTQLIELCLKSFKASLGGMRVKMWAILNDCPPEYDEMFKRVWGADDLVLCHYPGVPASVTLNEASRLLLEQTDAEIIYFACDDYFYVPGQFPYAVDFMRQNKDADFVSLYDHADMHTTDLHRLKSETREFAGKQWISSTSTTDTFMTTRAVLTELQPFFGRLKKDFPHGHSPDLAMWMALTKKRVFNPFKFARWTLTRRWFWAGSMALAWRHCWRQIAFGRRFKLWIPRPSITTHMVAGLEAPGIDWKSEFQKQISAGGKS